MSAAFASPCARAGAAASCATSPAPTLRPAPLMTVRRDWVMLASLDCLKRGWRCNRSTVILRCEPDDVGRASKDGTGSARASILRGSAFGRAPQDDGGCFSRNRGYDAI